MDDKRFSMIILVFVFIVAIPSAIFIFSDSMSSGSAVIEGMPKYLTNYDQNPSPYSHEGRGVLVPIYDADGNFLKYDQRAGSQRSQTLNRPGVEGTYYGLRKEGKCPIGCVKLRTGSARDTESSYVMDFNGYLCRCIKN